MNYLFKIYYNKNIFDDCLSEIKKFKVIKKFLNI